MLSLSEKQTNNAILVFENGVQIDVAAYGKTGFFFGYLNIIDGIFSISNLQDYDSNETKFFATNEAVVRIDDTKTNNHIILIANSFLRKRVNMKNITTISNLTPKKISFILTGKSDNFALCNGIKCALFFSKKFKIKKNILSEINETLKSMPENFNKLNLFKEYTPFKPYFLNNENGKSNKLNVAIINFNNFEIKSLEKIKEYFNNICILPYTETYEHIKYLYEDKKIDGVIIHDFKCNTCFIENERKEEIYKLLESKIPVLGIGNGAILIAELFNSKTEIINKIHEINNYQIVDKYNHILNVSDFCYKRIVSLSTQLKAEYYDIKNKTVAGFTSIINNNIGYIFSFTDSNIDTFISSFCKTMKNEKR